MNVLIIDDSEFVHDSFKILSIDIASHCNFEYVFNGLAALEVLKEKKKNKEKEFDLIFCDIDMPLMNGMEFYKKAQKEMPEYIEKIIFVSASMAENVNAFRKSIKNRWFEKPFKFEDIVGIGVPPILWTVFVK